MSKPTEYWFKRRRYGYGWTPVTWQGWTVVIGYLVVVIGGALTLVNVPDGQITKDVGIFFVIIAVATVALIRISVTKGPKPKWRWGKDTTDDSHKDF